MLLTFRDSESVLPADSSVIKFQLTQSVSPAGLLTALSAKKSITLVGSRSGFTTVLFKSVLADFTDSWQSIGAANTQESSCLTLPSFSVLLLCFNEFVLWRFWDLFFCWSTNLSIKSWFQHLKQTARTWEIAVPLRTFGNPHTFCSISHKQTHLPGQLCCMLCDWGLRSWLSSCPAMLNLLDLIFHGVMLSSAFCHPLLHCDYSFTYIDAVNLQADTFQTLQFVFYSEVWCESEHNK